MSPEDEEPTLFDVLNELVGEEADVDRFKDQRMVLMSRTEMYEAGSSVIVEKMDISYAPLQLQDEIVIPLPPPPPGARMREGERFFAEKVYDGKTFRVDVSSGEPVEPLLRLASFSTTEIGESGSYTYTYTTWYLIDANRSIWADQVGNGGPLTMVGSFFLLDALRKDPSRVEVRQLLLEVPDE